MDSVLIIIFSNYIKHAVPKQVAVSQTDSVFMKIYAGKIT